VTPITIATNTAGSAITAGTNPYAIAITPDGTKAYVAHDGSSNVTPITIAYGFVPAVIAEPAVLVAIVIGVTVPDPWLATYALVPSGVIAIA
jgi:DNA-binding beta-propeller fold protein YncE